MKHNKALTATLAVLALVSASDYSHAQTPNTLFTTNDFVLASPNNHDLTISNSDTNMNTSTGDYNLNTTTGSNNFNNTSGSYNVNVGATDNAFTDQQGDRNINISTGNNAFSNMTGNNNINIGTSDDVYSNFKGDNNIALGGLITNTTTEPTNNAVAIGHGSTASKSNSIVLGNGSDDAQEAKAITSATINGITFDKYAAGTPTDSVASIGSDTVKRQLINVGAGAVTETSTDAINGSQLYATNVVLTNIADSITKSFSKTSTVNSDGTVSAHITVNGNTYTNVQDALDGINTLIGDVSNKANTDLDNLTDSGKTTIKNLAKDAVKVVDGTNTTVTSTTEGDTISYAVNVTDDSIRNAVQPELDKKANRDASNLTSSDVSKWREVLDINNGDSLVKTDGSTITIDRNGSAGTIDMSHMVDGQPVDRVLTGIKTDLTNPSSAVNVRTLESEMNHVSNRLNNDIKHVGAVSAALAGLHPLSYDPSNKTNFAVAQGHYRGSNATAIGGFYQPNENILLSLAGTISSGDKAMNAGLAFRLGNGNTAKRYVKQADYDKLNAQNQALESVLKDLNNKVNHLINHRQSLTNTQVPFPDVPVNHWAKQAVDTLHGNDLVQGYEDGQFKGDRSMTRYEYAQMLYNAAEKL